MIGAIAGLTVGIGQSLFGGNSAAEEAKRRAERQAKDVYNQQKAQARQIFKRAEDQYELQTWAVMAQFYWDRARTAQIRADEAQTALDQAQQGQRIIEAAANSYRLNADALKDRFVTQEALRATEIGIEFELSETQQRIQAAETAAAYLDEIATTTNNTRLAVQQANEQATSLIVQLGNEEMQQAVAFNAALIGAGVQSSIDKARAGERSGGSSSAQRVAQSALRGAFRQWQQNQVAATGRQAKLNVLNLQIGGSYATRLANLGIAAEQSGRKLQGARDTYSASRNAARRLITDIAMPSFETGQRQYARELEGLQLATDQAIADAQQPYRQATIFDPIKPIPGLPPQYFDPIETKVNAPSQQGPTFGSVVSGALEGVSAFDPGFFGRTFKKLDLTMGIGD